MFFYQNITQFVRFTLVLQVIIPLFIPKSRAQQLPTPAQQQRITLLYEQFKKKVLATTSPAVSCPPKSLSQAEAFTFITTPSALATLYKNGQTACAAEILKKAQPKADSPQQIAWLLHLTQFLHSTQQKDSANHTLAQLESLIPSHSSYQGGFKLLKIAQYRQQIQFEKALETANEALQLARKTNDKKLIIAVLNEIGNTSRDIYRQEPAKYLPFFEEALKTAQSINDSSMVSDTYENLVFAYFKDASVDIEQALPHLEQAIAAFPTTSSLFARYRITNTFVFFLSYLANESPKIVYLFNQAIPLTRRLHRNTDTRSTYQYLADHYVSKKNFNMASAYLDSAQLFDSPEWEKDYFFENRALVAQSLGKLELANTYYKKALEEKERIYLRRNSQTMTQWETQLRTRETTLQLEQERRQQWFLWGIVVLVSLLFLVAAYSFWRNRKQLRQLARQNAIIERQSSELRQLDEAKTRFFSNITHEFRTPLTLIISPLEKLLQQQPHQPMLGMIHANASRLLSLINQLLDLSKIDAGALKTSISKENIVYFLNQQVEPFELLAHEREIKLVKSHEIGTVSFGYIDLDKLSKIITNLLSNAFKFTPKGGRIQYQSVVDEKFLTLTITDSGIGIPPEQLVSIFDRFYQVDSSTHRSYEGSGIGLSLVKELVGVLKGEISLESNLNQGTSFHLRFPIDAVTWGISDELSTEPLPKDTAKEEASLFPETKIEANQPNVLLIVEDNADLRTYIATLFSNYQLITAVDGQDGLQHALETIPDLIISDWMMPTMDGVTMCQHLKKDSRTSHVPVLLLTAKTAIESRLTGFEWGADDYIVKPFHATELQLKVRNWLLRQEKVRKHYTEQLQQPLETPPIPETEGLFMERLFAVIDHHLSDTSFGVDTLAEALQLNRRTLQRKVNSLTNLSPNELIRNHRLRRALPLLKQGESIADAAFKVGFETPSYFTKCFKETFGIKPSDVHE